MKFSIVTTIHAWHEDKLRQLNRCLKSVANQSYQNYEHIIVDDGSTFEIDDLVNSFSNTKLIKTVHNERVTALNKGFKNAEGKWICLLDADDEYFSYTLEIFNQMIKKNPKYRLFNGASYHVWKDWSGHIRGAFKPKEEKVGHEIFGRGLIVNGTYFFHRSVYEKLGAYPGDDNGVIREVDCSELNYGKIRTLYMGSPWDFSAAFQLEFPEVRDLFMVNHEAEPHKVICELGNPWGQDFALFYKYTRKYHTKTYDVPVYIVHHDEKAKGEHHELSD